MGLKGYDFFTALPGTVDEMVCKVCGDVCDVKRGVSGPMSWAGAMAKKNTTHDSFSCDHTDEDWHKQALKILEAIESCPSPSVRKLMKNDLVRIIKKKKVME